jgi:CDP-glucose 4,6-dehydratase
MITGFWKDKRVLITGHTGFKGSWLSLWLHMLGARVMGVALPPPTIPSLFQLAEIEKDIESEVGDIRYPQTLQTVIAKFHPEIVIHMAAQSIVRASYSNPVETYETNVMGTVHLLEAVRHAGGVKAVVVVTSDKCYENKEWAWGYRETDQLGGFDPYSNSKGCAELVTSAYRNSFFPSSGYPKHGVAVATARAGNVIGGGDWTEDQLIPDVIRAFVDGRPVLLRSPGSIRPWQFVLEPLSGYLTLAERLYSGGAQYAAGWNFGPGEDHAQTVQWIVERLSAQWGGAAKWGKDTGHHPHEAGYLKLDSSMARTHLGWRSTVSLETALDWTVEWYQAYHKKADVRMVTMEHIKRFMVFAEDGGRRVMGV